MVGRGDASANSRPPCQLSSNHKVFWRSASWSSSRTTPQTPEAEETGRSDPINNCGNNDGQNRRFPPVPLTPRPQQNNRGRSCLPPLQPLSIGRRSLDGWPKAGMDDIGEWRHPPTPSESKTGERLKLDLTSIQQNQDKNGGLVKRDKIAIFNRECSKVAEHIYLGGDTVARDRNILKQNGITHVLNCVGFACPEYFKSDFVYRTLWLQDNPSEDITSILYDVFDYFEDVREQRGKIFVHCCQGVSRSTSLVIAYLMWREGQSFDDAFQYVKAARAIADPNMGFACQLLQCQKRVHAFPLSPSSLLRMYRIAPHSPYDPLHLVPKMLSNPSSCALDSRGAFIVHIPSSIYVWIGKSCHAIMERDARGAVYQIVRYERVQGSITLVKEGEEPSYFWGAFSKFLPLMNKSVHKVLDVESTIKTCPGERKVDLYNIDFEIFQKAIIGGFVPPLASLEAEQETHLPARENTWSVLRRKNASGNMKEFVSVQRTLLSRVCSDSMIMPHSSANSSSTSSSSLFPTLSYLSSDSISSHSSAYSKKFTDSSLNSSAAASYLPVSSTISNLSNFSVSSIVSCSSVSSSSDITGANSTSCSQFVPPLHKRVSLSLAERRESLSNSLWLPVLSNNMKVVSTLSDLPASCEASARITSLSCSSYEMDDSYNVSMSMDHIRNGKADSTEMCNLHVSPSGLSILDSCQNDDGDDARVKYSDKLQIKYPSEEGLMSSIQNGMGDVTSMQCKATRSLVCRWPELERISAFGRSDLDSKDAYAICSWNLGSSGNKGRILYFWVGRSSRYYKNRMQLDDGKDLGDLEEIDWDQIGKKVLAEMDLPKEATIKFVKEDEEPEELLALLDVVAPT